MSGMIGRGGAEGGRGNCGIGVMSRYRNVVIDGFGKGRRSRVNTMIPGNKFTR